MTDSAASDQCIETSPVSHPRTLRRNVAAHVRGKGALLKISELDAKGLRMAQKEKLTDGSMDAPPDLAHTDAEVDGTTFSLHASLASIHVEVQKLSVRFEHCYGIDHNCVSGALPFVEVLFADGNRRQRY